MGIINHPITLGILIGNQVMAIGVLISNLFVKSFVVAFSIYGFVTLIIIYPTLVVSFLVNEFVRRRERKNET